ncbi:vesicle transport protein USE1 [Dendroctonus ponderosae]|uniref:Vesicle transport protein USE1 n=1 Tax=Dendroctonus ponderosae TaxID=77166 RepID=J3JWX7_DENPD|nr:vesicle transport protein USE1 [Dendroctonus ponderosae]AEE62707.1 unknown [Dendroctonus ponderosae]ERL95495.1 hypothetical protein D910_12757 [Dendroctonus ponderosae]KAH1014776.1 hypothetical protein HUJ05_012603 [Dendroctonus ponderosae]
MVSPQTIGLSRQEINLRRLLAKCELMSKNPKPDERFEKYIATLEDMVQEVKQISGTPIESIKSYQRRVRNIKTLLGLTTISKYEEFNDPQSMRDELLGLRQRIATRDKCESNDLDQVLKFEEDKQTKIADDVLGFVTNLKEQSQAASRIIKQDTEVVINATQISDKNLTKLGAESAKLTEHSNRAWKCWLWIMLAVVLVVFINMVLFMKLIKKNK